MNLITQYEQICNSLVDQFATKQDIEFDGWVGNHVGGVASFIDQYFFTINDIYHDLATGQPAGSILLWHDDNIFSDKYINYHSYCMGLRVSALKDDLVC